MIVVVWHSDERIISQVGTGSWEKEILVSQTKQFPVSLHNEDQKPKPCPQMYVLPQLAASCSCPVDC